MLLILIGSDFTIRAILEGIYLLEITVARPPVPSVSRSTLSLLEINANEAVVGGLVTR